MKKYIFLIPLLALLLLTGCTNLTKEEVIEIVENSCLDVIKTVNNGTVEYNINPHLCDNLTLKETQEGKKVLVKEI